MQNLNNYLPDSEPIYEDHISDAYHTERKKIDTYVEEDLSPKKRLHDYNLKSMIFMLKKDYTEEDVNHYMESKGYSCPPLDKDFKAWVMDHRRKSSGERRLNSKNVEEPIPIITNASNVRCAMTIETKISANGQMSWF